MCSNKINWAVHFASLLWVFLWLIATMIEAMSFSLIQHFSQAYRRWTELVSERHNKALCIRFFAMKHNVNQTSSIVIYNYYYNNGLDVTFRPVSKYARIVRIGKLNNARYTVCDWYDWISINTKLWNKHWEGMQCCHGTVDLTQ